jgi:hypothetical protein
MKVAALKTELIAAGATELLPLLDLFAPFLGSVQ